MTRSGHSNGPMLRLLLAALLCFPTLMALPASAESERRDLDNLDPFFKQSVLRGWRYFHTSFADDGVACVHCHRDHSDIASWAVTYPKVQIFDQAPYRVKTLRTVIIEAMVRHTDLGPVECGEMAEDLQAYITWWADGQALTPGISSKGATPEEDLAEFEKAVNRGRSLFIREKPVSCAYCHTVEEHDDDYRRPLKDVFPRFPLSGGEGERAVSFDLYLLDHYKRHGVVMSPRSITDIAAYLAHLSSGRPLKPGDGLTGEEATP